MFDWLFGGGWQDEPLIERKSRKRKRGPSWSAVGILLALASLLSCGAGVALMEARLELSRLWP